MTIIDVCRYEFKYLLRADEVPEIRRFLLRYCTPDLNAQGMEWYGIQSLYLDTPEYGFYRASVEKAVERIKLRIRAYAGGAGPVKLKIKRRRGDVVSKKSFLASQEAWRGIVRDGVWSLAESNPDCLPFVRFVEKTRARPRVLVTYERHALYSNQGDYVRVTFDRRILSQRMHRWSLEGDQRGWLAVDDPPTAPEEHSTYVLELKFKSAPPAWLRDIVTSFGLVRRGFSKFSRSVTRMHTDWDPAWDLRSHPVVSQRVWRIA